MMTEGRDLGNEKRCKECQDEKKHRAMYPCVACINFNTYIKDFFRPKMEK